MALSWNNCVKRRLVCRTYLPVSADSFGLRSAHGGSSNSLLVRLPDNSILVSGLFRIVVPRPGRNCFLLRTRGSMASHRRAEPGSGPVAAPSAPTFFFSFVFIFFFYRKLM